MTGADDNGLLSGQQMYTTLLVVLCVSFVALRALTSKQTSSGGHDPGFAKFQRNFVATYLLMMAADWMQGPTVYALYKHYGFTHAQNAQFFVAGFGSSMVFGTFAGTLADKYGRKLNCIIYGIAYGLCCITKHFNDFGILMAGRLLGGFSTSILWSAFESWMVCEHNKRGFNPTQNIGSTFSLMITGNGLVAIASGFAAQGAVWAYDGHPVAPFDLSFACLVLGTVVIAFLWTENYGDQHASQSAGVAKAWASIRGSRTVQYVGLIQALFEGAMYTFVFMWTPTLETSGAIPHGFVFACFMMSCSVGASVFGILSDRTKPEVFMPYVFLIAAACMLGPVLTTSPLALMSCFCIFEVCVGIFWPSIMSMRSRYLPEEGRATVMNIFRIPLNALVLTVLLLQGSLSTTQSFGICAACISACAALQLQVGKDGSAGARSASVAKGD